MVSVGKNKRVGGKKQPPNFGSRMREGQEYQYQSKGGKLRKRLGKGWQKKVYGKNYKFGTVKNLNEKTKSERSGINKKTTAIKEARKNLSGTTDATKQAAINARLKTLETERNSAADQIKGTKAQKQKFINLREKALQTTAVKAFGKGQDVTKGARKQAVHERLDKANSLPTNSEAQNDKKPYKVNVGEQKATEFGNKEKQAKTNEGKKSKAQQVQEATRPRKVKPKLYAAKKS